MLKKGSGSVLSSTSAATTVVGTVAWCQPLGTNFAVEMASPLASTFREVCNLQPSRSGSLFGPALPAGRLPCGVPALEPGADPGLGGRSEAASGEIIQIRSFVHA